MFVTFLQLSVIQYNINVNFEIIKHEIKKRNPLSATFCTVDK